MKRIDSLALWRRSRRVVVSDERRVCIDRYAATVPPPKLLDYLQRLRSCSEEHKGIMALLISNPLASALSRETIDAIYLSGLIPTVVQCLTSNDLLRLCACRIIHQIVAFDNAMHMLELNRCNFGVHIVSAIDTDDDKQYDCVCATIALIMHKDNALSPIFRLELLVYLVHTFVRTPKAKTADLINDVIRVMIDRSEFGDAWSESVLPSIFRQIIVPNQAVEILESNLRFLLSLTQGYGFCERIDKIVQYGFVPTFVRLISWPVAIQVAALKVIKNISSSYDEHIPVLMKANLLVPLKEVLQQRNTKAVRHLTLEILSNISGGHRTEVVAIVDAGFVPIVLDVIVNGDNASHLIAIGIINNITNRGSINEISFAINCGALKVLCKMLTHTDNDIIIVRRQFR